MTVAKGQDWLDRYRERAGKPHPFEKEYQDAKAKHAEEAKKGPRSGAEFRAWATKSFAKALEAQGRLDEAEARAEAATTAYREAQKRRALNFNPDEAVHAKLAEEEDKALIEYREAAAAKQELVKQVKGEIDSAQKALWDALKVEDPSSLGVTYLSDFKKDRRGTAIQRGVEIFQGWVSAKVLRRPTAEEIGVELPKAEPKAAFKKGGSGGRSYCAGDTIAIAPHSGITVVLHELGHFLEHHNPLTYRMALAFKESRTAGEKNQSLAKLTGVGYKSMEVTKADKFLHPYMGKHYPGATEIVSMGMEYLSHSPLKLIRSDPQYFDFMYSLLRGDMAGVQAVIDKGYIQ